MAILLVAGEAWVKRSGRSREFLDSSVITIWGIGKWWVKAGYIDTDEATVTVFTDHTELTWTVDDMQHVSAILLHFLRCGFDWSTRLDLLAYCVS